MELVNCLKLVMLVCRTIGKSRKSFLPEIHSRHFCLLLDLGWGLLIDLCSYVNKSKRHDDCNMECQAQLNSKVIRLEDH